MILNQMTMKIRLIRYKVMILSNPHPKYQKVNV